MKRYLTGALALLALIGVTGFVVPLNSPLHVPTNAQLALLSTKASGVVVRDGYTAAGDHPPLTFVAQTGTCLANTMTNDGGSCVNDPSGNSWKAMLPATGLDPRWFGKAYPIAMYVDTTGTDANSNYCLSTGTAACATASQAVVQLSKFNIGGQRPVINVGAGTFTDAEIVVNGPLMGASQNDPSLGWEKGGSHAVAIVGAGSASTTITTTTSHCDTLNANYGGVIYVEALTVTYGGTCAGAPLYTQFNGTIVVGPDVVCAAGTASDCMLGEEAGHFIINPGVGAAAGLKLSGTFTSLVALGTASMLESDSTINFNSATFTGNTFYVTDHSTLKLDGNPAVSGVINGTKTIYLSSSTLTTLNEYTSITTTVALSVLLDNDAVWDTAALAPPVTVNATSNLGTGGSAAVSTGCTPYRCTITLTAGTGALSFGNVTLNFPYQIYNGACTTAPNPSGTGSWNGGVFNIGAPSIGTVPTNWGNNGTALAPGSTYKYNYVCR